MPFASPLWLLGLLPWATVAVWLLLGRRVRVAVPFIPLWRGPTESPRARPFLTRPPLPILLAISSLLLAVIASARPLIRSHDAAAITIIVDRGMTMSARGTRNERFKETCGELARHLPGDGPIYLIVVPGGERLETSRSDWTAAVDALPQTLKESQPELASTVRNLLADGRSDIIVVSDQPVPTDSRVMQIQPARAVSNLTIANVAARATPRAQVMVELRDQNSSADVRPARVRVESAGHAESKNVRVPRDGNLTVFIDMPALGSSVSITVESPDDLAADNLAWLAREQRAAQIDDSPALPDALRRMIAIYNRHRAGSAKHITIVTEPAKAPADEPSVIIARDSDILLPTGDLHVENHPISANVDWAADVHGSGNAAPPDFKPIVSMGDLALVATREAPARSVWIDIEDSDWPAKPDFVVFWTNVFDWLGGEAVYRWQPLADHAAPGIEPQSDGSTHAFNAINVTFPPIHKNDWNVLQTRETPAAIAVDLTPVACLIAIALMTGAIFLLKAPAFHAKRLNTKAFE